MRRLMPNPLITACCTALVLATSSQAGLAQDAAKFGFVNISQVITQSDEGRAEAAELEAIGAEMEKELTERRRELEALVQQYEEGAGSGEPDTALRARIERMQRELERDVRQAQSDVDTSRQDRIQAIGNKAVELVRRFARDNDYTAIFRTDGGQVVYAAPEADITDRIIEAYNEAHPVD